MEEKPQLLEMNKTINYKIVVLKGMARTWIKSLHVSKKRTRASVIADIIDYINNPEKTDHGKLISSYACDSRSADAEFILAKRQYEHITGRFQGRREVIANHITQSFKPGEVVPETANRIGYELAMSFTKGNHAFVVATHIDKKHIHNHIIFNTTALSCDRKFRDFKNSHMAVRRISDLLCLENGLSVIEKPKLFKFRKPLIWSENKEPTWQEKLRMKIDEVIPDCSSFDDFLEKIKAAGYVVKERRKHISVIAPGQKKPSRLNTLKGDYTEAAIRERIAGTRIVSSAGAGGGHVYQPSESRVSLLIDIQAKIIEGKGEGYERWARIFNLREAAKTLLFLQDNGIDSYDDLVKKASSASGGFSELNNKIKVIDKRLAEISELQKQIGIYSKTRNTYAKYKASGWDNDFYETERADITLHRAAKKYFDSLGMNKIPPIAMLKQEYAVLIAEKKKLYSGYRAAKDNSRELLIAKDNADRILGINQQAQERELQRKRKRNISHDR